MRPHATTSPRRAPATRAMPAARAGPAGSTGRRGAAMTELHDSRAPACQAGATPGSGAGCGRRGRRRRRASARRRGDGRGAQLAPWCAGRWRRSGTGGPRGRRRAVRPRLRQPRRPDPGPGPRPRGVKFGAALYRAAFPGSLAVDDLARTGRRSCSAGRRAAPRPARRPPSRPGSGARCRASAWPPGRRPDRRELDELGPGGRARPAGPRFAGGGRLGGEDAPRERDTARPTAAG